MSTSNQSSTHVKWHSTVEYPCEGVYHMAQYPFTWVYHMAQYPCEGVLCSVEHPCEGVYHMAQYPFTWVYHMAQYPCSGVPCEGVYTPCRAPMWRGTVPCDIPMWRGTVPCDIPMWRGIYPCEGVYTPCEGVYHMAQYPFTWVYHMAQYPCEGVYDMAQYPFTWVLDLFPNKCTACLAPMWSGTVPRTSARHVLWLYSLKRALHYINHVRCNTITASLASVSLRIHHTQIITDPHLQWLYHWPACFITPRTTDSIKKATPPKSTKSKHGDSERWGAGVETQKNVLRVFGGWGRVPFNEPYAPSLSTIYDGA